MIDPKDLHNTDLPSDSLDDLMDDGLGIDQYEKDAAAKALADMPNDTEAVFTDARHQPHRPSYRQVCGVCGGSGNWRGRAGMSCFPCKGKGFVEFRTSPEVRRNDRNRSAKKKAEQADKNLADFEAQNPHIKAWWTDTDFGFALSLRESARKWGKLTENQLKAAEKCILAAAMQPAKAQQLHQAANDVLCSLGGPVFEAMHNQSLCSDFVVQKNGSSSTKATQRSELRNSFDDLYFTGG